MQNKGTLSGLHQSLLRADRIVVSHVESDQHYVVPKPELRTLLDQVSFNHFRKFFQCICYSDMVFYVFRGNELLEVFAYFEEGTFAWHKVKWTGDAELNPKSHDILSLWFHQVMPTLEVAEGFVPPSID